MRTPRERLEALIAAKARGEHPTEVPSDDDLVARTRDKTMRLTPEERAEATRCLATQDWKGAPDKVARACVVAIGFWARQNDYFAA